MEMIFSDQARRVSCTEMEAPRSSEPEQIKDLTITLYNILNAESVSLLFPRLEQSASQQQEQYLSTPQKLYSLLKRLKCTVRPAVNTF